MLFWTPLTFIIWKKNTWSDLLLWMIHWYRIKMFDLIIIKQFVFARSSSETFFLFFFLLLTIWAILKNVNQVTIQHFWWIKQGPILHFFSNSNSLFRSEICHISNVKLIINAFKGCNSYTWGNIVLWKLHLSLIQH